MIFPSFKNVGGALLPTHLMIHKFLFFFLKEKIYIGHHSSLNPRDRTPTCTDRGKGKGKLYEQTIHIFKLTNHLMTEVFFSRKKKKG